MKMCDKRHEEIVHEGYDCPLCKAEIDLEAMEAKIEELQEYIKELEKETK